MNELLLRADRKPPLCTYWWMGGIGDAWDSKRKQAKTLDKQEADRLLTYFSKGFAQWTFSVEPATSQGVLEAGAL